MSDKRSTPRSTFRRTGLVITEQGYTLSIKTVDISAGGLCILVSDPLQPGANCMVKFELPLADTLYRFGAMARITHCTCAGLDGFRAGLQFTEISDQDLQRLQQLLAPTASGVLHS